MVFTKSEKFSDQSVMFGLISTLAAFECRAVKYDFAAGKTFKNPVFLVFSKLSAYYINFLLVVALISKKGRNRAKQDNQPL